MDSLPLEILTLIINAGDHSVKKAPFAALSKTWQAAMERYTFAQLYVQTREQAEFQRILAPANRRSALAHLRWRVTLPPYPRNSDDGDAAPETVDEQRENDVLFTKGVVDLLALLASWEKQAPGVKTAKMLTLELSAQAEEPNFTEWGNDSVHSNRFMRSLLRLRGDEPLPLLERPVALVIDPYCPRNIEGVSIGKIACAFSNLVQANVKLFDGEKLDPKLRQQQRFGELLNSECLFESTQYTNTISLKDMAKQLRKIQTKSLTHLFIDIFQNPTRNEDYPAPIALHASEPSTDHLSEAIHQLSLAPTLKYFFLSGFSVISDALFWPKSAAEANPPTWPNLEVFIVEFDMKTPDGDWYYLRGGQPSYLNRDNLVVTSLDDEDHDELDDIDKFSDRYLEEDAIEARVAVGESPYNPTRNIPDTGKLVPFFKAVARAAAQMPKLRVLTVKTVSEPRRIGCEVAFAAPGVFCQHDERFTREAEDMEELKDKCRLFCRGSAADETCLNIWREGEARKGRELHVHVL